MENVKEKFIKMLNDYNNKKKSLPDSLKNKEYPFHVRIHPTDFGVLHSGHS